MNNATDGPTCGTLGIPIEKFSMHFGKGMHWYIDRDVCSAIGANIHEYARDSPIERNRKSIRLNNKSQAFPTKEHRFQSQKLSKKLTRSKRV